MGMPPGIRRIAPAELRKAFFPVFRISSRALELVDQRLQQGWTGHYEVLVPTLLHVNNMQALDLNDVSVSYVGDDQVPGKDEPGLSTMRWRPDISLTEFRARSTAPLLFHPVKQEWYFDGSSAKEPPAV